MKNLTVLIFLVLSWGAISAQCVINPYALSGPGASPTANRLPCIVQGVAYDQVVQGQVLSSYDTAVTISSYTIAATAKVDSVELDSIAGLPSGISWTKNPNVLPGGQDGCVEFTGTTSAATGNYPINGFGTAWLHLSVEGAGNYAYTYKGELSKFSPYTGYYVVVIAEGASCPNTASGINDMSAELDAAIDVYPNPNNGSFSFKLNAAKRVNGELTVRDITGRKVYSQLLDVIGVYNTNIDLGNVAKGLYTMQIRTADGYASKKISIE